MEHINASYNSESLLNPANGLGHLPDDSLFRFNIPFDPSITINYTVRLAPTITQGTLFMVATLVINPRMQRLEYYFQPLSMHEILLRDYVKHNVDKALLNGTHIKASHMTTLRKNCAIWQLQK